MLCFRLELGVAIGDGVSALASLGVTFGGFSPTAMDGVEASKQYIKMVEELEAERKEARKRLRELEFARTSKESIYIDDDGNTWSYVVVDKKAVRILACESTQSTLNIPGYINGLPVYEIASDACSRNNAVETIICSETVEKIGPCAFRLCPSLRKIVFPKQMHSYSSSWLSGCPRVEDITLPDNLEELTLSIFDRPKLNRLVIGSKAHAIEPGAFQASKLKCLEIDQNNPFVFTDGIGIYSSDGKKLIALARPVCEYDVLPGCEVICKKAAYNIESLERVCMPESLHTLEEFAFSHSGIKEFEAPKSLKVIAEKAFFYCNELKTVVLNEGLKSVGGSAFAESGIDCLKYPASIEHIGRSATYHTNIVHSGPNCSLSIDSNCRTFFLDREGGLYRHEENGSYFVQLVDPDLEVFNVQKGTNAIGEYAFAHNGKIRSVSVPDGVTEIQKNAFRCCKNLESIDLPDTVVSIGDNAFLDTNLTSFRIPADLEELGKDALITCGAHHGDQKPSLVSIDVAPGNSRFYMSSGMLCRRMGEKSNVVLFDNSEENVIFPPEIDVVESYAFNNARGIRYLELNSGLRLIESMGLTTWCWIELIHIELKEPVEGRTSFDFRFPNTAKGVHGISQGIGGATWVNIPGIMAQYDNTVLHAHDYNSPKNPDSIPIYDQVKMILDRLDDPILLSSVNKNMYERLLRNYIEEICVDVARHDDREVIAKLVDLGYVNEENLERVIAAVGRLQDAAMTAFLLEVKRMRFSRNVFDFDL